MLLRNTSRFINLKMPSLCIKNALFDTNIPIMKFSLMSYVFFAVALVLGIALPVFAQSADDWSQAEEVVRTIRLPKIPNRDYVITNFGAKSGGTSDARPAILAAIKKPSTEGGGASLFRRGNG